MRSLGCVNCEEMVFILGYIRPSYNNGESPAVWLTDTILRRGWTDHWSTACHYLTGVTMTKVVGRGILVVRVLIDNDLRPEGS